MSITTPLPAQGHERPRVTRDQQRLNEIEHVFRRFMHFPHEHAYTMATLWVAHSHLRTKEGDFLPYVTPRVYFGSMRPNCGKTLALELTTLMSYRGEMTLNPTEPGLISMFHNDKQTVGLTEIDKFFGERGHSKEGHKAVINGGYKRGATVSRERGGVTEKRNVHGPMALDGKNAKRFLELEGPFDAVRSRSIAIILDRKPAGTQVTEYDPQRDENRLRSISARLAEWGCRNARTILSLNIDSLVPAGIDNRDKETWRVLFQIAAFVGGGWVERIQAAARALILGEWGEDETPVRSYAEQLLHAARGAYGAGETFLPTRTLVTRLMDIDGWWRQEWTSPRAASMSLADELATFGIEKGREYVDGKQERGYALVDLLDVEDDPEPQPEPVADVAEWNWDELEEE
jgi:hypothetical protein